MDKSEIRLNNISARNQKPCFKAFNKVQTDLLKASLIYDDCTRQIDSLWRRAKYDKEGKLIDSSMDWEVFETLDKRREKASFKIIRLENKHNLDEKELKRLFMHVQAARCGGSF